jgi:hypothetical protein
MDEKSLFLESCIALEKARGLINSVATADSHKSIMSLQSAAADAMLTINRVIWELWRAHREHGPEEKASGESA